MGGLLCAICFLLCEYPFSCLIGGLLWKLPYPLPGMALHSHLWMERLLLARAMINVRALQGSISFSSCGSMRSRNPIAPHYSSSIALPCQSTWLPAHRGQYCLLFLTDTVSNEFHSLLTASAFFSLFPRSQIDGLQIYRLKGFSTHPHPDCPLPKSCLQEKYPLKLQLKELSQHSRNLSCSRP